MPCEAEEKDKAFELVAPLMETSEAIIADLRAQLTAEKLRVEDLEDAAVDALEYLASDRFPHKSPEGNDRQPVVKALRNALIRAGIKIT